MVEALFVLFLMLSIFQFHGVLESQSDSLFINKVFWVFNATAVKSVRGTFSVLSITVA